MKKQRRIKGFTLAEVIVNIAVMAIVVAVTGSMLVSGMNMLFYHAEELQQRNIADAVCGIISDKIMYDNIADEISISDGHLMVKYDEEFVDVFGDEFYNGYTVDYSADIKEKSAKIIVYVYENGDEVCSAKKSVIIMNNAASFFEKKPGKKLSFSD